MERSMWEALAEEPFDPEKMFLVDRKRVAESHRRCARLGLSRDLIKPRNEISPEGRAALVARYERLVSRARPLFNDYYRYVSDRRVVAILTDGSGDVVEFFGPPKAGKLLEEHYGIRVGVSLQERSAGTNAIALALRERETLIVKGDQHFCRIFHGWRQIAAPVYGSASDLLACISLAGPNEGAIGDTFALTQCLATLLGSLGFGVIHGNGRQRNHTGKPHGATLTDRQRQVLSLYARGLSYRQIASALGLRSTKTVEQHLTAIRKKLAGESHRACILTAARMGLL